MENGEARLFSDSYVYLVGDLSANGNYAELRAHAPERVVTLPSAAPLNGLVSREPALLKQLYPMVIQLPWNAGNPFHFPPPIAFVDTLRGYLHRAVFGTKVTRGFIASLKSLRGSKIRERRRWNLHLFKIQNGRVQVFELKEPFIVSGEKWKITNGIFLFFFLLFLHFLLMNSLWTGRKKTTRKNFRGTLTSFTRYRRKSSFSKKKKD